VRYQSCEQRHRGRTRRGCLLEPDAGVDGDQQPRQIGRWQRRLLARALVQARDQPLRAGQGALVGDRVAAGQLGIAYGVDPEVDDQQPPLRLSPVDDRSVLKQSRAMPSSPARPSTARVLSAARSAILASSSAKNTSALPPNCEYTTPVEKPASSAICSTEAP